jgi:PST family polysaccharide transporter
MLKAILGNAFWLTLVQLLNYVLPVITLAVIAPSFGSSVFGIYAAVSAYAAYVGLVVNYGFNLTGPLRLAKIRDNMTSASNYVCAVIASQLLLAAISSLLYILVLMSLPLDVTTKSAASIMLIQVIANSLTPQWVFLGFEQLRSFSLLQLSLRLGAVLIIIWTIRSPRDLLLLTSINAITAIITAVASFGLLRPLGIRWYVPTGTTVIAMLREAFRLFISSLAVNLYTTTNVIIVAGVLGPSAAGAFALADRLGRAASDVLRPVMNAVYPFVCRISGRTETNDERGTKHFFFRVLLIGSAGLSMVLFLFAPLIVQVIGGVGYQDAVAVLRYMAILPLMIALANIFGYQTMIPLRMDRQLTGVTIAAAVLSVVAMFALSHSWGLNGAGFVVSGIECFVTIALGLALARKVSLVSLFYST